MRLPSPAPSPRMQQNSPHPQHAQHAQHAQQLQRRPDVEDGWAVRLPSDSTVMATAFGGVHGGPPNGAPGLEPDQDALATPFGGMGMPMGSFSVHMGQSMHSGPPPTPPGPPRSPVMRYRAR